MRATEKQVRWRRPRNHHAYDFICAITARSSRPRWSQRYTQPLMFGSHGVLQPAKLSFQTTPSCRARSAARKGGSDQCHRWARVPNSERPAMAIMCRVLVDRKSCPFIPKSRIAQPQKMAIDRTYYYSYYVVRAARCTAALPKKAFAREVFALPCAHLPARCSTMS